MHRKATIDDEPTLDLVKKYLFGLAPDPRPPDPNGIERWDRSGTLRRARRIADLSQRDMAERIGVGAGTIARAETDGAAVSLAVVEAILAQAGLRIVVVDAHHHPVMPMRADAARNHGGRRYPAHLDAWIPTPSDEPLGGWRHDRPKPRLTFQQRFWRDRRRGRRTILPRDHSAEIDLRLARHLRRRRPTEWMRRVAQQLPARLEECRCGPRCIVYCVPQCRCQCEPIGWDTIDLGSADRGVRPRERDDSGEDRAGPSE